jgi:hypothetical protein
MSNQRTFSGFTNGQLLWNASHINNIPVSNSTPNNDDIIYYNATNRNWSYGSVGSLIDYCENSADGTLGLGEGTNCNGVNNTSVGIDAGMSLSTINNNNSYFGAGAGMNNTGDNNTALGANASANGTSDNTVAVGTEAGNLNQQTNAIAIGFQTGYTNQGQNAVAIGVKAGGDEQGDCAVAIGSLAGQSTQGVNAVAIGCNAGLQFQLSNAISIGCSSGQINQGTNSIAIGFNAGYQSQTQNSIAIGNEAANEYQNNYSIAIGNEAAKYEQNVYCVAIGNQSGYTGQGQYSIAIGNQAGQTNQSSNSIVLNANSSWPLDNSYQTNQGLFVNPIRGSVTQTNVLGYNTTSKEITYYNKTFVIPHPNNQNKYLVHACLEGPESGVYYRGKSEVVSRFVEIALPDYVNNLATDFTVNVTSICSEDRDGNINMTDFYATEVANGKFRVYSKNGERGKFHWTVFGKRNDIEVEPNRSDVNLRGTGPYTWVE